MAKAAELTGIEERSALLRHGLALLGGSDLAATAAPRHREGGA